MVDQSLMSFQERLLNHARKIHLVAQPRRDLEPGQETKVSAESLQLVGLERFDSRLWRNLRW
jgi:hypothetical protein